jgi:hypothetical protein
MIEDSSKTLENEFSDWLVKLIREDRLFNVIVGKSEIEELASVASQEDFIPAFTSDYLSRTACIQSANYVLDQLSFLEIIAVNKSISISSGEVLRPDIIAFNPEQRTIVIFEIKRDVLTERQAVTELMAYEHEIQNNFPFLSNFEMCFVVVATHWSTLMDHAVASMVTWSNKQCLAIHLKTENAVRELHCRLPSAWSLLGSIGIPPQAIQAVDLVLYEEGANAETNGPPPSVFTAAQMIVRNGDRANSHGFLMLWQDCAGMSGVRWVLTISALDPLVFFFLSRDSSNPIKLRDSKMSAFFEERSSDLSYGMLPSSAMMIARDAIEILKPEFSPQWEGLMTWDEKIASHRKRAVPLYFEFWGKLGEYIRHFVGLPAVRKCLMPYIHSGEIDWTAPEVAIPVIEDLAGRRPLKDGLIRCSDAFEIGESLQLLLFLYKNRPNTQNEPWHAYLRWCELHVLQICIELVQVYYVAKRINVPPPPISFHSERCVEAVEEIIKWVDGNLIGKSELVIRLAYNIGLHCSVILDPSFSELHPLEDLKKLRCKAAEQVRSLVALILMRYNLAIDEGNASSEHKKWYKSIRKVVCLAPGIVLSDEKTVRAALASTSDQTILASVKELFLPAADAMFPPLYINFASNAVVKVDWDWLKDGVTRMFKSGEKRPAVIRQCSGVLGTGPLQGPPYTMLVEISDPAKEVYFLDHGAALSIAVKMTWDELRRRYAQGE